MLKIRSKRLLAGIILLIFGFFYWQASSRPLTVDAVVVRLKTENTNWLEKYFPQWNHKIYTVDDPDASLTVEKNKGRESMPYLTYIIDNYDSLPDIVLFLHSQRWQWHNDDPDYDGVGMLSKLQLPYIRKVGFTNLRCALILGCPNEILPLKEDIRELNADKVTVTYKKAYKDEFQLLFPGEAIPEVVAAPCCAQFAASRETIRQRPKSDYVRYRNWLLDTKLADGVSGRILEYSWHMIFGKEPMNCPDIGNCYCKLYGICKLKCKYDQCNGRYILPPYVTLPNGWPLVDWDGSVRGFEGPLDAGEMLASSHTKFDNPNGPKTVLSGS